MDSNKRKTLCIKAQMLDVQSLKVFQDLMPNYVQRKFMLKYGRILDLLGVPVKVDAITALTPFYDSPLRCFLFKDFQLALMLEEFGLYLDLPEDRRGPYIGMGKKLKPKKLAMTLGISPEDLLLHYKEDNNIKGLKRGYLEGIAQRLADLKSYNLEQKDKHLLESMEEAKTKRSKRQKTLRGLFSVGIELENLNKQLKKSQKRNQIWYKSYGSYLDGNTKRRRMCKKLEWSCLKSHL
ncbi:hypothetical protein KIW84_070532 [Lathyrus oleraceus]|uniref:DUF7745 domain-containing protein n=1 Tax=Pisum sativum TaxID=3888 RepID=A0A9D4VGJ2_PEA|nr:hypothetical protein KIW84_070532 [Pisum sativum]